MSMRLIISRRQPEHKTFWRSAKKMDDGNSTALTLSMILQALAMLSTTTCDAAISGTSPVCVLLTSTLES